jgi:restriction system protein
MAIPRPRTRQFDAFTANIDYSRRMVNAGKHLAPFRSPEIDVADFYRAAWVQAVSALDHWIHEELWRRVADLSAKDSPEMPPQLRNFDIPLCRVEEIQRGEAVLADVVLELVKDKWAGASLQNPGQIALALKLVTTKEIWKGAATQINAWNGDRTNYTEKTLKAQYSDIVKRRNKIAHDADLVEGDLKERRPITEADVSDAINWIERIALALAHVLGE